MGPWCTWFVVASVWCTSYGYSLRRLDSERDLLDRVYTEESNKFFEELDLQDEARSVEATRSPGGNAAQRQMFLWFAQNETYTGGSDSTPLDSWSVVWYVASFGGLIVFFLIVSCSEWCCRRAMRNSQNCNRSAPAATTPNVPDTPPPSYDQFAPPSYESICLGRTGRGGEKSEYDIYVVPVHTLGTLVESRRDEDAPPSYFTASRGGFVPALRA